MTTEYRGDEQRYDPAAGAMPDRPFTGSDNAAAGQREAGQGTPPYRDGYPPADPNAYPGGANPGAPNPGLAALLGFIPGVGAMYNGQFAKGLAHIAIFAVFCSLSKHVNGIFGLFIAGWVLYMAFEAYQTAVARRDGLPLPDPFGLNNIGERFGFRANPTFSSFWAHGAPSSPGAAPQPGSAPYTQPGYHVPQPPFHVDPAGTVYRAGAVPGGSGASATPVEGSMPGYYAYNPVPPVSETAYGTPTYGAAPYGMPPVPPVPPAPPMPAASNQLPTGAFWLIGLGFFALLGSVHALDFLEGESTGGIFLIGLSLFLFWRRWNQSRQLYAEGSAAARWSVVQGIRGAGVLLIVGLLTLLQGLRLVYWENSWPLLLIALGVLLLLERLAQNQIAATTMYAAASPVAPAEQPSSPTSILPRYTRADEDPTRREGQQP